MDKKYDILYEDEDIIVVYKHRDVFSVKTDDVKTYRTNLYYLLLSYCHKKNEKLFIVHRLDFETSGVMIFAKKNEICTKLRKYFASSSVVRLYEAVVRENVELNKEHEVRQFLKIDRKVEEDEDGKESVTIYKAINPIQIGTALKIQILTGRKNQIRMALKKDGLTLIGDRRYSSDMAKRLYLNAYTLAFPEDIGLKMTLFKTDPLWIVEEK